MDDGGAGRTPSVGKTCVGAEAATDDARWLRGGCAAETMGGASEVKTQQVAHVQQALPDLLSGTWQTANSLGFGKPARLTPATA